jgi:acetylornithine/succinyldiaminopimelate/putrescine aminotransferase
VSQLKNHQLLLVPAGENVVRFLPALIISEGDISEAINIFRNFISKL